MWALLWLSKPNTVILSSYTSEKPANISSVLIYFGFLYDILVWGVVTDPAGFWWRSWSIYWKRELLSVLTKH